MAVTYRACVCPINKPAPTGQARFCLLTMVFNNQKTNVLHLESSEGKLKSICRLEMDFQHRKELNVKNEPY